MPWKISEQDGKFCVTKEGGTSPVKGGCHANREEARKHQSALYAAEEKEISGEEMETKELYEKMAGHGWQYVPWGINSFGELDASRAAQETAETLQELTSDYTQLIRNIVSTPDTDIAKAVSSLTQEFAKRVSVVKSEKKSWMDNLKEKFTKKPKQDPAMMDDNGDEEDGEEEEPKQKKDLGMMVWKEADDTYRFIARYSNNLRDTDNPPEIISAASHERFIEMVENKEAPLPEVWLWHIPEWRCGQADWVTLDKQDDGTTFAIAGGHFFKEANWLAQTLAEVGTIGVSHGMPKASITRDANDPSIITSHITREISPLPQWAAANKWADFKALPKENSMSIPDLKKQKLTQEWNLDPERLAQLEALNTETAGKAKDAGIERKETTEETPAPAEERKEDLTPTQPVAELSAELVTQLATALKEVITPVQADVAAIADRMTALEDKVKELTATDDARMTKQVATIPTASLGSLLVKSIIGETGTRVDGRTTLANSKPTLPADYKKEANPDGGILSGVVSGIIAEHTHTTN